MRRLDQIVSVVEETRNPLGTKPDSIKIGLANGRAWRVNAAPFKTSMAEMIAGIEAHATGLRKGVGESAGASPNQS